MKIEWSEYQKKIFDTYKYENCNIAIEAGPGASKTTVLKQLSKLTPHTCKSIFLAFNRSIVDELKQSLPASTEVSTLHGLGCRALYREYGNIKVVESKTFGILKKLESKWLEELTKAKVKNNNYYLFGLSQLYDLYRINLLTSVDDKLIQLANRFGIETSEMILDHFSQLVVAVKKTNALRKGIFEVDYVDMIYLPVVQDLNLTRYDRVFLDESQDLNLLQHQLVEKLLTRSSRLISVGDPRQCIYAFLGASTDSFNLLSQRENTVTLTLPVSYRCPISVIEKINSVFNVVKPAPNAIQGEVRNGSIDEVEEKDMVLCRNNKPLLAAYFYLLDSEIHSYIRGVEFGKAIYRLVFPYKGKSIQTLFEGLYRDLGRLEEKLHSQGVFAPTKHKTYLKLEEDISLTEIITKRFHSVNDELLKLIDQIFRDKSNGVMLSTIHKAKGLESDRVFLLNPELIPSKFATQEWEIEQEKKLLFVAYSRPKKELVFIRNFE